MANQFRTFSYNTTVPVNGSNRGSASPYLVDKKGSGKSARTLRRAEEKLEPPKELPPEENQFLVKQFL